MSEIRNVVINSHKYDGLSYYELNEKAKIFDNLTQQELQKELESINSHLCRYSSESVFLYRIAMNLYNVVAKRHKHNWQKSTLKKVQNCVRKRKVE